MRQANLQLVGVLNSATAGLELAASANNLISNQCSVVIDLSRVDRVTPSFANAFVMRVMDHSHLKRLEQAVTLFLAAPHVSRAFADAESRYLRGIRLSDQRQPAIA